VFPLAIGGTLIITRVCEPCNSWLGTTADAPLANHLFVLFPREDLKLPGNSGVVPNATRALFVKGVLANDRKRKIRLEPDASGRLVPHLIYAAKDITLPSGEAGRSIAVDASTSDAEVRKIVDRERKRAGYGALSDAEFNQIQTQIASSVQTIEQPEVIFQPTIDLLKFRYGLLKIAYELAWLWLGEAYLDDPTARTIRRVLAGKLDWETSQLRGTTEFGTAFPAVRFWASDKTSHLAFSMMTGGRVGICIRVFQAASAVVSVSENPERYSSDPRGTENSRFISIDPVTGAMRQTSLVDEFSRLMGRRAL